MSSERIPPGQTLTAPDRLGFWEQRGYHDEADPRLEQRHW